MAQRRFQLTAFLLLTLGLFFLSNATALIAPLWLTTEVVRFELLFWLMLTLIIVWEGRKSEFASSFIAIIKTNWIILPFVFFAGISIFWSVYWEISLYRWLIYLSTIVAGGYIGLKYDLGEIIELLSVFGVYVLLFSTILVFFVPDYGVMNYHSIQGAWKGVYWHKNHMGLMAVFINVIFLLRVAVSAHKNKRNLLFWGFLYIFSLLFIFQTDSVASYLTSIVLHGLILISLFLLKYGRRLKSVHYLTLGIIALVAIFIMLFNLDFVFGIFNRNTSLTGRVPMWDYLFNTFISMRLFGGYGFNAFWYIEDYRIAIQHVVNYPDQVIIAYNGFIDILVYTGYVGLGLFALFYFGVWWYSIQCARKARDIIDIFPLILMFYTLIANISWSLIFENEGFFLLVMIVVLFSVSSRSSLSRNV